MVSLRIVASVTEPTTVYTGTPTTLQNSLDESTISVFPNPAAELVAVQIGGLQTENVKLELIDIQGRKVAENEIRPGSTISYFDVETVYSGTYMIRISRGNDITTRKVMIVKE